MVYTLNSILKTIKIFQKNSPTDDYKRACQDLIKVFEDLSETFEEKINKEKLS